MKGDVDANDAREFLRQGTQLKADDGVCPFCSQVVDSGEASALMSSYNQYFSQAYNTMSVDRHTYETFFSKWDVVSQLGKGVIELSKLDVEIDLKGLDDEIENAINFFLNKLKRKKTSITK